MRHTATRSPFFSSSLKLAALISMIVSAVLWTVLFSARLLRANAPEIAYIRTDFENPASELLVMDVDYGYTRPVARVPSYGTKLWSPDGHTIAAVLGGQPLSLTHTVPYPHTTALSDNVWGAAWSPDGSQLALVRMEQDSHILTVVNARADTAYPTARRLGSSATVYGHAWSPDGSQIVYTARDGMFAIYLDGSGERRLGVYQGYFPAWSPAGDRIAFQVIVDQQAEIFTIGTDGSAARRLTFNDRYDTPVGWLRRGDTWYILALTMRDGARMMHVVDHEGAEFKPLIADVVFNVLEEPVISLDGRTILFAAHRPDMPDSGGIYQVSSDGDDLQRLTVGTSMISDILPVWRR